MGLGDHYRKQVAFVIRLFHSTDLFLYINTSNIFIKVRIFHCMHWLAGMSWCGTFRGCGQTGWRQFGFAGHCKVVLKSTVRAILTPWRTLKLVPDMHFNTEPVADFFLSSGGGGVFSLDWLMALTTTWLIPLSCWLEVSYDLQTCIPSV